MLSLITRARPRVSLVKDDTAAVAALDIKRDRRVLRSVVTVLAAALVIVALLLPNKLGQVHLKAFMRIPAEGIIGIALLLVWPTRFPRLRQTFAAVSGVLLGALMIVKFLDMGFYISLARPFDLVLDWVLMDDALSFLGDSLGEGTAKAIAVGIVVLVVAVLALMALSMMRLSSAIVRNRTAASRSVAVLGLAWALSAALGWQAAPGLPVAAKSEANLAMDRAKAVKAGWADRQTFANEASVDAYADVPADQLLTGLRGKDVMLTFVESYGRDAVEDPEFATQVSAVLADGQKRLGAKGFETRSAFLTSSTVGGGSWLAHSTTQSGLWIDNQMRYTNLIASDRLTISGAFKKAGWRTVGAMPAIMSNWGPEANFFGLQKVYDFNGLEYKGPRFGYAPMPDQYTLSKFHQNERAQPHAPLMAEIDLISSHSPWTPVPHLIDWNGMGDGSVFFPQAEGPSADEVWSNTTRGRAEYRKTIEYSLSTIISYVENYGDENLVLVFLGDHQPAPLVTGDDASRDVPITIIAAPSVMDRINGWNWQEGMKPTADGAPVWRMNEFRDRFFGAFGPNDGATPAGHRTN